MADAKDLENGSHNDLKPMETNGSVNHLRQMMTNNTISDEQFERLFLSPRTNVTGDLRKRFANPTPLAIMGFSVGLTPLSAELMGWRGAGEMGTIQGTVGASLSFGALLLLLAGIGEFIVGNTFPMIVFMGYGCHFLTASLTFIPFFNAVSAYSSGSPYEGAQNQMMTPAFANSFAFYFIAVGVLSFCFLILSIRTNLFFAIIFVAATIGFGFAAGGFWQTALGNMEVGANFLVGAGACFWAASMCGWYLLLAIMIPIMELPIPAPPIVDFSTVVRAKKRN